jgi:hypothetical protein
VIAATVDGTGRALTCRRVPYVLVGKFAEDLIDGIPVATEIWLSDEPFNYPGDQEAVKKAADLCAQAEAGQ